MSVFQVVSKMVYEAGMDVSDLYEAQIERMQNVQEKKLVLDLGTVNCLHVFTSHASVEV